MAYTAKSRQFGAVRKLASKRWQASYSGPDGKRHTAPMTFDTKQDALAWLVRERGLVQTPEIWTPPRLRNRSAVAPDVLTFKAFADDHLQHRKLKARTKSHYAGLLAAHIYPTLGPLDITKITPATIRNWYGQTATTTPTVRAHAYGLVRSIFAAAVGDQIITWNPCTIRGAGQAKRASKTEPASVEELEAIIAAMPDRYRLMVILAAWCALRFGELTELRAKDIKFKKDADGDEIGIISVTRGVVWVDGEDVVGPPKSEAGRRDVTIPPHLLPAVRAHVRALIGNALLFPAVSDPTKHMRPATLYKVWYPARAATGREDLRFHDLRHTGAVLAAQAGATLAELMGRLGHSTPQAAMRYQHAAKDRDAIIARRLSALAPATPS